MMKETYNYKTVWDSKVRIKQLTDKFSLKRFHDVDKIVITVATAMLMFLVFRKPIASISKVFPMANMLAYIVFPYFSGKYISKLNPDGKKLHVYIADLFKFYTDGRMMICNDKKVRYLKKKVVFEKCILEKVERENKG